jgi:predicted RNase H-like nuclease
VTGELVIGVDGAKFGWVAVFLVGGAFSRSGRFEHFAALLDAGGEAKVIAVDIPIGLPEKGAREADALARKRLGARGSSVFPTPTRAVLGATSYAAAAALQRLSQQTWAIVPKIREVDAALREERYAAAAERVYEVHPELSFLEMAKGAPLSSKRTWNGLQARQALLLREGIQLPADLGGAGEASPDDILDAAAAAWSARRIAAGRAEALPARGDLVVGRHIAIWF